MTPIATLADVTPAWGIIATRVALTPDRDGWDYTIPAVELDAMRMAVETGRLVTGQRRTAEGFVLLARLSGRRR